MHVYIGISRFLLRLSHLIFLTKYIVIWSFFSNYTVFYSADRFFPEVVPFSYSVCVSGVYYKINIIQMWSYHGEVYTHLQKMLAFRTFYDTSIHLGLHFTDSAGIAKDKPAHVWLLLPQSLIAVIPKNETVNLTYRPITNWNANCCVDVLYSVYPVW